MRRAYFGLFPIVALLAAVLTAGFLLTASGASADSVYSPVLSYRLCNAMPADFFDAQVAGVPACAENLAASATANHYSSTSLTTADLNTATSVTFVSNSVSIAGGGSIGIGAKVGGVRRTLTVGMLNSSCDSVVTMDTVLYNVALPNNAGNPRSSTNIAFPRPDGSANRFDGWNVGSEPAPAGGTAPVDAGAGHAGSASLSIQNYPAYLLDAFDPDFVPGVGDGGLAPVIPHAVYGGLTKDAAGAWLPLYVVQFDNSPLPPLGGPFAVMSPTALANMGQASVQVVNDPTAPFADGSGLTTICTPSSTSTVLLGKDTTNTYTRATSPASATTGFFTQYNASQRDTDQDGYDNSIDTCPVNVNAGNPRVFGDGDVDGDGIDNACDANVPTFSGDDVDSDGFRNRQDNCPQKRNGTSLVAPTPLPGEENQKQSEWGVNQIDRGPRTDLIGDACDSENTTISVSQGGLTVNIAMSDTIANGKYMIDADFVAKCIGGTDADADGYCSGQDSTDNPGGVCTPKCHVRHSPWTGASHPVLQLDTDLDAVSDMVETYLGTDPEKPCAQNATANDEIRPDTWPYDFNDNQLISGPDIIGAGFSQAWGFTVDLPPVTVPGQGLTPIARMDFNGDGIVSGPDLLKYGPVFAQKCGSTGFLGIPDWAQQ